MTTRILLVNPSHGVIGGIEQFQIAVAKFLALSPDISVRLLVKVIPPHRVQPELVSMLDALSIEWGSYTSPLAFPLKMVRWADLVYVQNPIPEVCFSAKLLGKRLVVTLHNWLKNPRSIQGLRWRASVALADVRWYNSRFVRSSWESRPPTRRSEAFPTVSDLRMDFSAIQERRGFVFVGRWIANKGIPQLVEAYDSAQICKTTWPLIMMGKGPLLDQMQHRIALNPVPGLHILGGVSEDEKFARIRSARWLVAPPNTIEDMGLTPIEARSQGVPCIVTAAGGLPEVAGPGAIIVAPGDVDQLRTGIERVAAFSEEEYRRRADATFVSLRHELRLGEFYRERLCEIAQAKSR